LVADAAFVGYELMQALVEAQKAFLIRLSSRAPLYVPDKSTLKNYREGLLYYWPQTKQKRVLPPLPVRLIRIGGRKVTVWLITNVEQRAEEDGAPVLSVALAQRGSVSHVQTDPGQGEIAESHGSLGPP
jgi:hypothetical protein